MWQFQNRHSAHQAAEGDLQQLELDELPDRPMTSERPLDIAKESTDGMHSTDVSTPISHGIVII